MVSEREKAKRVERVVAIVAEQLGVPIDRVADRMSHLDGIAMDSLDVVEIVMELEEEFDDDDPGTAGSLARLIQPPDMDGGRAMPESHGGDAQ